MWKYYRPGLISLVFLPILFIPFVKKELHERDLRIIKLNIPSECENSDYEWCNEDMYKTKDIEYYSLDALSLKEVESYFAHLSELRKDSTWLKNQPVDYHKAYVLNLSNTASYGDIVNLLNLCLKYDIKRFQLDIYKDKFAFQEVYNLEPVEMFGGWGDCIVILEEEKAKWGEMQTLIDENYGFFTSKNRFKYYWVLAGWVVLCAVIIFWKRRMFDKESP